MERRSKILNQLDNALNLNGDGFIPIESEIYDILYFKGQKEATLYISFDVYGQKLTVITGWIAFSDVEEMLRSLLKANGLSESLEREPRTLIRPLINLELGHPDHVKAQSILLTDDISFNQVAVLMKSHIQKVYIPFLDQFSELKAVNESIIDKVNQNELSQFIPGLFMDLKKMIIMKICNNPGYSVYRDWIKNFEEKDFVGNPVKFEKRYRMFLELIDLLEKRYP